MQLARELSIFGQLQCLILTDGVQRDVSILGLYGHTAVFKIRGRTQLARSQSNMVTKPDAGLRLRLMATSDLHAHLIGWDYDSDRVAFGQGLARVAGLIKSARAELENCLLFDNGDFLNGSPLGDYFAAGSASTHPMIAAMNHLAYDAATLGNHEFSEGLTHLFRALDAARFPVVSTNFRPKSPEECFAPFLLLSRDLVDNSGKTQRLKIGILGFLPPQTRHWEADHLQDRYDIGDIVTVAHCEVPKLRAAGADIVVALAHSGLQAGDTCGNGENVARALAQIVGIDAVFAGHIHEAYPPQPLCAAKSRSAPVAMPGFFGSHLGVIDLDLCQDKTGWTVVSHRSESRPVAARDPQNGVRPLVEEVAELRALARPAHAALRSLGKEKIGTSSCRLHSYFALVRHSSALALVASAQRAHLAAALVGGEWGGLPILSAVAPFKVGGRGGPENFTDIPAGPLLSRHSHDLYLHPNDLVAFRLSGAEVLEWLERSVSLFNQIVPGVIDQQLINPSFPGFNFDVIHGLEYQINLTKPARYDDHGKLVAPDQHRISDLRLGGVPLAGSAQVILGSNSFRLAGGGGFPASGVQNAVYRSDPPVRALVQDHGGAGGCGMGGRWGFDPIAGAGVILETSPVAETLLAEIARFRPESLGRQENGFHAFRLWL